MTLTDIGFANAIDENPPDCVLGEPLTKYLPNVANFSSVVLALTFDSGSPQRPTARSYVFYFYRGEVDTDRRPDDMLTFKIKFSDPSRVHIVDKYLGGMAIGVENAPPLNQRHLWRPGMMSQEGQETFRQALSDSDTNSTSETKKTACFIATAAFGTPFAKEVRYLCEFRDNVLQRHAFGRGFVRIYYKTSPHIAKFISKNVGLRWFVRTFLIQPVVQGYLMYRRHIRLS